jgi:hypothetical protein
VSAAATRPRLRLAHDLSAGTYTTSVGRPTLLSADRPDTLEHGGLDLWPRMLLYGCSDAPVRAGSISYPQRASDSGDRTKWQPPARDSIVRHQFK